MKIKVNALKHFNDLQELVTFCGNFIYEEQRSANPDEKKIKSCQKAYSMALDRIVMLEDCFPEEKDLAENTVEISSKEFKKLFLK